MRNLDRLDGALYSLGEAHRAHVALLDTVPVFPPKVLREQFRTVTRLFNQAKTIAIDMMQEAPHEASRS